MKRVSPGLPVHRDPAFIRFFADNAFIMALGRDVDIAFLAAGPSLQRIEQRRTDDGLIADMQVEPSFAEVARARLSPVAAVTMAMNVLQQMVASGDADKAAILKAIEDLVEPEGDAEENGDDSAVNDDE